MYILVARKNARCVLNTNGEIDEYRRIVGANVEVLTEKQPRRVTLGKVNLIILVSIRYVRLKTYSTIMFYSILAQMLACQFQQGNS